MKHRVFIAAVAALFITGVQSEACTSVIVSGKATPDGRPLMWKNRDTGAKGNYVRFFPAADWKYSFTAVVNEGDEELKDVWIGTNSEGFSIMNTHSYNITDASTKDEEDLNGSFMRTALETCASVEEFEEMILRMPKPWRVSANFGVIDGRGGAAYFEMNWTEYFKFDVNDPSVAPDGYLVRTNYSFNGRPVSEGTGHVRYLEADRQMKEAMAAGNITTRFFLEELARDYANPLLDIDYRSLEYTGEWAVEQDIIVRYKTTCSAVIQGVKPGENPALSTMWTIIGYPGTTVCLPVWGCCGQEGIPELLRGDQYSELSRWGGVLRDSLYCFDMDTVSGQKYFKRTLLVNKEGTGYLQTVLKAEPELLEPYVEALDKWRACGQVKQSELLRLNKTACRRIRELYGFLTGYVQAGSKVGMEVTISHLS